jgi:hypothetical protein
VEKKSTKEVIDNLLGRLISRKLLVFSLGTGFFIAGMGITPDDWMTLAVAYVGTQGFIDAILAFRGTK